MQSQETDLFNKGIREELEKINQSLARIKSLNQRSSQIARMQASELTIDKDVNELFSKSIGMWNSVMLDLNETTDIDLNEIQRQSEHRVSQSSNFNVLESQLFPPRSVSSQSKCSCDLSLLL
jgi:methionine synthase I (cobalamin-dependent)